MLIEEADRQKAQFAQRKGLGKGKEDESEALAVGESSKGKRRRRRRVLSVGTVVKKDILRTNARNRSRKENPAKGQLTQ